MKIEAVVVCVNYADFLAFTLPANKHFFDRMVVVTDTKDTRTKDLCEFYHVECIQTDAFYENGSTINKAEGINMGLEVLKLDGWVVQLDADIYLPPLFRHIIQKLESHLNSDCLYTLDRMMCPTFEAWIEFLCKPTLTHTGWIYIHPTVFPMGVRIAEYMEEGYEPIGYFQMWNPKGSEIYNYPVDAVGVDRTDVLQAKRFPRNKRILIPELICIHLESEGLNVDQMGKNWFGRKTKIFGPDSIQEFPVNIEEPKETYVNYATGYTPMNVENALPQPVSEQSPKSFIDEVEGVSVYVNNDYQIAKTFLKKIAKTFVKFFTSKF
jgi:hypothetical protein